MKIFIKNKYKFLFLPNEPLVSFSHSLQNNEELNNKLEYLIKYYIPSIFYKKRKTDFFLFSSGDTECMSSISFNIHLVTDTLLDYLEEIAYIHKDWELKHNLDCLDKNYNTSNLDFLFILDFSLLYKKFENQIEKELFRKILKETIDNLYVINTALLHSWPHTRLCRTEIILSQEELKSKLVEYIVFEPKESELWKNLEKKSSEILYSLNSKEPTEEVALGEKAFEQIVSLLKENRNETIQKK